jgi:glycosyltransferase involved in cell wall biosynthesis
MKTSKILVVMPAYNAEKTIDEAISSIVNQTHQNWTLFIIDDNSTDKTVEVVKKYLHDERIFLYKNSENRGAYYSRNAGLYLARNMDWSFFTTHDADDISYNTRFAQMLRSFNSSMVNGSYDTFRRINLKTKKEISVSKTVAHAFFTKEVFNSLGYFEEVRFGADWEYWQRLLIRNTYNKKNKTVIVSKVLGDSYVGDHNLTVSIPLKSPPRESYISDTKNMHNDMAKRKQFYMPFRFRADVTKPVKKDIFKLEKAKSSEVVTNKYNKKKRNRVTVVLLTWQRIPHLKRTLATLVQQTYKDFDIHISNGNLRHKNSVEKIAKSFADVLDISISHDGNDVYAFRRLTVGRELHKQGTEVILFIDDDISFPETYVQRCVENYKPKTYQSGFCWSFQKNGENYYKYRTKVENSVDTIHYCGTGISVIDASIFANPKIMDAPPAALKIEDLWLSYFAQHVLKWDLKYIPMKDVTIGGSDGVALYKSILQEKKDDETTFDKADFLTQLIKEYGWKLPA